MTMRRDKLPERNSAGAGYFPVVVPARSWRRSIFLALALAGCSHRSVDVSITNHSSLPVPMIYVCNSHSCQRVGSLAPGASVRVTEPLAGDCLLLTYWTKGHQREFSISDARIHSGLASLTIGTNYLVEP